MRRSTRAGGAPAAAPAASSASSAPAASSASPAAAATKTPASKRKAPAKAKKAAAPSGFAQAADLSHLADELLRIVLYGGYLGTSATLRQLNQVCGRWRDEARAGCGTLDLRSYAGLRRATFVPLVSLRFNAVVALELSYCTRVDDGCLATVAATLARTLRRLSLRAVPCTDDGLVSVGKLTGLQVRDRYYYHYATTSCYRGYYY